MTRKLLSALALTVSALALQAGAASAASTFGASASGVPTGTPGDCAVATDNVPASCTLVLGSFANPAEAASGGVLAPMSGVITRWRVTVGPAASTTTRTFTPRLFRFTNKYTGSGTGTPQSIPTAGGALTFEEHLPVLANDILAMDSTTNGLSGQGPNVIANILTSGSYISKTPPVPDGGTFPVALGAPMTSKLMISADIEPDLDGDRYGDETQDLCTTRADLHTACLPPTLSNPKFSKGTFAFTSDIAGKAETTLFKVTIGRKAGKKCKSKAKTGKKCKIYTKFAAWKDDVVPGSNKIEYAYKVGGKSLKPGSYRATIAVTSAQNTVATKTIDFKIKAAKKKKKK